MLNYVSLDELENEDTKDRQRKDFIVGLLGRSMREADSKSLIIIHIEDKR